jgi:hypothetical protein
MEGHYTQNPCGSKMSVIEMLQHLSTGVTERMNLPNDATREMLVLLRIDIAYGVISKTVPQAQWVLPPL